MFEDSTVEDPTSEIYWVELGFDWRDARLSAADARSALADRLNHTPKVGTVRTVDNGNGNGNGAEVEMFEGFSRGWQPVTGEIDFTESRGNGGNGRQR